MDDLLSDFLTETNESLAELDVALVTLERTPDDADTLSFIFRLVHTIKGTCGFLGLPRLERVAHAGENVLGKLRDRSLTVTPDIVSQVLAVTDQIKVIVVALGETGAEPAGDDSALIAQLNATAAMEAPAAAKPAAAAPPAPAAAVAPSVTPAAPVATPAAPVATTAAPAEPVAEPAVAEAASPAAPAQAPTSAPVSTQTIRVTVDVLEDLMTLVSELVLTRNQLLQLARTQGNSAFTVPLQRLSHITSDLQEGVMKTRMQPIGNAWNKLPRLVRDLSHDLHKKIELTMLGAETELDRQVLELIKDPLTHMIRNSGDHGLETPAERRAAGKPEVGNIVLNAFHEGGYIILEISDDGRGLAVDRIKAKVLSQRPGDRGRTRRHDRRADPALHLPRWLLHRRDDFSCVRPRRRHGRGEDQHREDRRHHRPEEHPGPGDDVHRQDPADPGDRLCPDRRGRQGTLRNPAAQCGGARQQAQRGTDNGRPGQVQATASSSGSTTRRYCVCATACCRWSALTELLELGANEHVESAAHVVVAQVGQHMMGIIVDRVFDTEEIVVKPVAPILRHVTMFSGNTILGDGSVIMILDPNGIARASGVGPVRKASWCAPTRSMPQTSADKTAMLLFRAGENQRMGVPLGLVARLEDIPREKIEMSCGSPVTQYRGKLMPLIAIDGAALISRRQPSRCWCSPKATASWG